MNLTSIAVFAAVALCAVPAAARAEDMNVNLTTSAKPKSVPPIKCSAVEMMINGNCNLAMAKALRKRGDLQQRTGELIADGKCDEALKDSLREGDFAMADKVKEMCAALYPPAAASAP